MPGSALRVWRELQAETLNFLKKKKEVVALRVFRGGVWCHGRAQSTPDQLFYLHASAADGARMKWSGK